MGSRDAKNGQALAWAKEVGAKASAGTLEPGIQAPEIKPE
jgi:hypothetical protein